MRQLVTTFAAVVLVACGTPSSSGPSSFGFQPSESDSAEMMAAALTQLITQDHTFGQGAPPFTKYLIEERTRPNSLPLTPQDPDSVDKTSDSRRQLTGLERSTIEAAISEYGPVQWIEDPDEWRIDLEPKIDGSVILGVDAPRLDEDGALAPVSLWCGGDCGTWFTYRLEIVDGAWAVTGKEGPVAIS